MAPGNRSYLKSEKLYAEACQVLPGGVNSSLRNILPHLMVRKTAGALLEEAIEFAVEPGAG